MVPKVPRFNWGADIMYKDLNGDGKLMVENTLMMQATKLLVTQIQDIILV